MSEAPLTNYKTQKKNAKFVNENVNENFWGNELTLMQLTRGSAETAWLVVAFHLTSI